MITATYKGKYYNVEYSVVNVSELEGELRIDAEYYEPFYIKLETKILKKGKKFFYYLDFRLFKVMVLHNHILGICMDYLIFCIFHI